MKPSKFISRNEDDFTTTLTDTINLYDFKIKMDKKFISKKQLQADIKALIKDFEKKKSPNKYVKLDYVTGLIDGLRRVHVHLGKYLKENEE